MNYYVVMPDGQKYGPATEDVLTQWASEGRLSRESMLEQEGTGQRLPAGSVPGIVWPGGVPDAGMSMGMGQGMPPSQPMQTMGYTPPQPNPYSQPPGYTPYQRGGQPGIPGQVPGQKEITWAWVCGALGLVCCGIIAPIIGLVQAGNAEKLGHPSAKAAKIFNIVVLVLGVLGLFVSLSLRR